MSATLAPASTTGISVLDGDLAFVLERMLIRLLPQCPRGCPGVLESALHYCMFPGGKRLRPLLAVFAARIFGEPDERVLRTACAIEFVHASSLILDDLPCMDDADWRRGNPALHCVYGEDIALLTALALLNQAYALFGSTPELIREAAACIGIEGMIGGQAIDLHPDGENVPLAERDRKTSALMGLALTAGGLALGVPRDEVSPLAESGQLLGRAYQICDDLLDSGVPGPFPAKTVGQDRRHRRPTHAVGFDGKTRRAEAASLVEQIRWRLLDAFGPRDGVNGLIGFIDEVFTSQFQSLA